MEAYQARLDSFKKSKRVKQTSSKRTASVKWPHPDHFTATPDALAEAGFFYNPSWDERDNAACFFCAKELSGWEEEDDPFAIHLDKCGDSCAWAVVRCGLSEDMDQQGHYVFKDPSRVPTSKTMEKARLSTFKTNGWWPHDQVKGHGAHSAKMAKAGFVYTPQASGDDTATCFYCQVSLSGWDEDDDPLSVHSMLPVPDPSDTIC
ncbi:inhibitor of apoptosis repeat-containing protein [Artomyces pyxidatus]|uniref:Inhibitor of apoptosis repeat-containing protein n=1 Tax=Artomyces pyxidatus TaxID=48021 RepID=A0ACB8SS07_9AGAM|nr:inhibitor of apoptosis repeat-containing protein [Artomyces pyxidatus]